MVKRTLPGNRHVENNQDRHVPLPVGYLFLPFTQKYSEEIAPKMVQMLKILG